jgi:sterol desaturase/sphingolipid hydroxylase (fatty acid hydroxylase superfamily)
VRPGGTINVYLVYFPNFAKGFQIAARHTAGAKYSHTPQFHHWHHAIEREAIDKNFAVHFPALDLLFGTFYLPKTWPSGYGIHDKIPRGWLRQLCYPFLPRKKSPAEATASVEVHS